MQKNIRVLMFGPGLDATSGISAVVNHWLSAGIGSRLHVDYVSTLDDYVPGQFLIKLGNALRAQAAMAWKRPAPELVHLHMSYGMSFYRKLAIFLIARLRGIKTIVHLHGSTFKEFYYGGSPIRKRLIRFLFDNANAIIVLSESWKSFIEDICSNRRIYIVHNGAPVPPLAKDTMSENGSANGIMIAFMGRLGERKGIYDLLQAFQRLSTAVPNAFLVLGGDGEIDTVQRRVQESGLEERVQILGWVSGKAKTDVFDNADIYVLPSYNEGLPGSILEAMAAATPIVSTPVGGIPEAVIEGTNGFLVEPGDVDALYSRLLTLCENNELRERMGKASRQLVEEKFNIDNIVDTVVEIYEDIISS